MTFPIEFIGADDFGETIRDSVNQQLSQGGKFRAFGNQGGGAPDVNVATGTWTDLPMGAVASGDLGATLSSGAINIPAAAAGHYYMFGRCTWKNDHAALAKHRRRLRITLGDGSGGEEGQEMLFDPSMGDLGTASTQFVWILRSHPVFFNTTYKLQAWQNSGDTIDVLTQEMYVVRAGDS